MRWGGWDPDGEIQYYEYCITDNEGHVFNPRDTVGRHKWHRVYGNDSTFKFTADVLVDTNTTDLVTDFTRSHTFFIRAVDTEGLASRRPAYRSFTAHTLSPRVTIDNPKRSSFGATRVAPITTFKWTAKDYISDLLSHQEPDSVSYLLEQVARHNNDPAETIEWIRRLPVDAPQWGKWQWYEAPGDSGRMWTSPKLPLGQHVFAIRAKDEAGAITPVFDEYHNLRRVNVSESKRGPILTLHNLYLGKVVTNVADSPLTIMDSFAGIPLQFTWWADASDYGGTVVSYRYGWDIVNLNDPQQWEVSHTPFPPHGPDELPQANSDPREYYYGTHIFTIEVKDNSGFVSRKEIKVNIVKFTMTKPLLIVDDYKESSSGGWIGTGNGAEPSDEEHDLFWVSMASNVRGFNPQVDVEDVTGDVADGVALAKLADYKTIIWSVRGHISYGPASEYPHFYDLVRYRPKSGRATAGKQPPNSVALFMAAGGHLMVSGNHPMSNVINRGFASGLKFPLIWKYDVNLVQGGQDDPPTPDMIRDPPGDECTAYLNFCLETMDIAVTEYRLRRSNNLVCSVAGIGQRFIPPGDYPEYKRTRSMRAAIPLDPSFPRLELRPETAGPGKAHAPDKQGLNVEVYNPQYFFDDCRYVQGSRDCFEPVYGLECLCESEATFTQPIAFWTSAHADAQAKVPGAIPARSIVFGFQPVLCDTSAVREAIEHVLFDEWQLPRR
jgi:hypothetical protein